MQHCAAAWIPQVRSYLMRFFCYLKQFCVSYLVDTPDIFIHPIEGADEGADELF